MRLGIYLQASIAAAAMPVVGFITGKVVGEASNAAPLLAWTGVGVYAVALAASYAHLRHYYARFDAEGVKASPFIAFAVEVATFYLSFASVVLGSPWALWGSVVGAGVVFWGNLSSMSLGLGAREGLFLKGHTGTGFVQEGSRVPPKTADRPTEPLALERGTDRVERLGPMEGGLDQVLLQALRDPKGPSALARELSLPKSTVARRLKRLVELGLVEADGGVYRKRDRVTA